MRIVTLVIVAGVAAGTVRALRRRGPAPQDELWFRAPPGQDPAAVLGALRGAGITAEPRVVHGATEVVIRCRPEDRERVRTLVQNAPRNMDGDPFYRPPVRFAEKQPPSS